jgi:hypothetical protein
MHVATAVWVLRDEREPPLRDDHFQAGKKNPIEPASTFLGA